MTPLVHPTAPSAAFAGTNPGSAPNFGIARWKAAAHRQTLPCQVPALCVKE
jgi:hypothetical protein